MSFFISDAHAQAAGGAAQQSPYSFFLMMGVMLVAMYFLLIRPQQKRAKEHQNLLSKLAAGDECVTAGGILGKVIEVGDNFLTIEIAENVRIKVQRFQVTSLVPKGTLKGA